MRISFTRDQAVTRLEEIQELASKLVAADAELRGRSYDPGRGWPNSSGPGGGNGGGPSIMVPDDDGNYERIAATSVEIAALTPDQVGDAKVLLWAQVQAAHSALSNAWNAYEKATRPFRLQPKPSPVDPDKLWCTSCARAGVNNPRGDPKKVGATSTLCGWCHDYQRSHGGQLPPARLCELRAENVRLTTRIVADVEAAERRDRNKKRSKKRGKR